MSSNLLQDAVLRAAHQREQSATSSSRATSPPHDSSFSTADLRSSLPTSDSEAEDVYTTVHTPADSRVGSRSTSPTRAGAGKVGAKARREQAAKEKASSWDPLRRLPNELSVRVFELVGLGADGMGGEAGDLSGVRDLLVCGRVCKRWRRSATINYIWYRLSHLSTFEPTSDLFTAPTWSRKDAKRDWCSHYRRINRRDDLETPDAEEAELARSGYQTPKEEREARWKEEAEAEKEGLSKAEARAYYKEMGGRKARGKTGKGAARDRTGWEDAEDVY